MLLASCVAPRAKLAFSWLPWFSWYSAGIGMKAFRPPSTRIEQPTLPTSCTTESTLHGVTPSRVCLSLIEVKNRASTYLARIHVIPATVQHRTNSADAHRICKSTTFDFAHVSVTVTSIVSGRCSVHTGTPPFSFCRAGYIHCLLPSTGAGFTRPLRTRVHSKFYGDA